MTEVRFKKQRLGLMVIRPLGMKRGKDVGDRLALSFFLRQRKKRGRK